MEPLLNRWRGTGLIIGPVAGVHVYALYVAIVVGLVSTWYWGLLAAGMFLMGESFSWGKWVGYLTSENGEVEYDNKTGRSFPYIHYIANGIVDQEMNYRLYCQVALAIRGLVWWLPVLAVLGVAGVFPWWLVLVNGVVAGIGFPVACEIGKRWQYTLQSRWLNMSPGWENQEVVYGVMHFLVFTLSIVLCKVFLGLMG